MALNRCVACRAPAAIAARVSPKSASVCPTAAVAPPPTTRRTASSAPTPLRRQGDHRDHARGQQLVQLARVRVAQLRGVVRAAPGSGEPGPLQVHARDLPVDDQLGERVHRAPQLLGLRP
jgi:hypothetical protein